MELADTGVWARKEHPAIAAWFAAAVEQGEIATCDVVVMEMLHSARNIVEFEFMENRVRRLSWIRVEPGDWDRALDVYRTLARQGGGHQRMVQVQDLLIAACAERVGVTVVHYDSDYESIARVTGQSVRWVAPRGTL